MRHWNARKRSISHEKLSFIVRTMWAASVKGEWFKLAVTDKDFKVNMSTSCAHFRERLGITSRTVFLWNVVFVVNGVCGALCAR